PRGFQQQENAALPWVIRRQAPTVSVQGRPAWVIKDEMAVAHVLSALALFAKAQILDQAHDGDGERVIRHQDIDFRRAHPSLAESDGRCLGTSTDGNIPAVFAIFSGLARTDDPHWLLAAVARHGRGSDDHRAPPI